MKITSIFGNSFIASTTILLCCISTIKPDVVLANENLHLSDLASSKLKNNQQDDLAKSESILKFAIQKKGIEEDLFATRQEINQITKKIETLQRNPNSNAGEIQKLQQILKNLNQKTASMFEETALTGKNIIDARSEKSKFNNSSDILIRFDNEGSQKFQELTKNIAGTGRSLGIFMNGELISAASVAVQYAQTGISGGEAVISGNFSSEEAEKIAAQLLEQGLKLGGLTPERKAQQLIKKAEQQYQQKKFTNALANYNQAIKINPQRLDAYIGRGAVLTLMGDHKAAIENYEKLIKLYPRYITSIYKSLIKNYLSVGDKNNAIKVWERLADADNSFANVAPMGQAFLFLEFKEFPSAINKFNKTLQLEPKNIWAYWFRGLTHEKLDNQTAANHDFRKVKDFNTDFLLRNSNNLESLPSLKMFNISKEQIATTYYIKSLACNRLNDKSCAIKNRDTVKKLLKLSSEAEVDKYFSRLDASMKNILDF